MNLRHLILSISIIFSGFIANAQPNNNPQMRACRLTNGLFHAVNVPDDQIGLCLYGRAAVDTISLVEKVYDNQQSLAVQALYQSAQNGYANCQAARAQLVQAQDLEGAPFQLCKFSDASWVELKTLQAGLLSSTNAGLKSALETKF